MPEAIVHEDRQDARLLDRLAALPEGENLRRCIQCGTCGGACPVAPALPHTPRRIVAMIRAGMKDEVLRSPTPWTCASCYACTVQCPAGVRITELMYALKRLALREGVEPRTDGWRFAAQFTDTVRKYGRAHEMQAVAKYMLLRHPGRLLGQSASGLGMMARGRMPLLPHRIKDRDGFRKMYERAEQLGAEEP